MQVGTWGGRPASGLAFGAGHNAAAQISTASMIDFYHGGGADIAVLGMGEVP